jgi:hypothetical protein
VATTALAGNRAVHLLRAGDELFLLGSSEQSVTGLRAWGLRRPRARGRARDAADARRSRPRRSDPRALRKLTVRT